jgi:uncharacterized protein
MVLADLVQSKRTEILSTAKRYGVKEIRLFGSVARGDDVAESDVDFLVELFPGRSLFDLGALVMDLRDLLGVEVDVVTPLSLNKRIREKVLHEARKI